MIQVIYFIQEGTDGPIKIGRTTQGHIHVRLSQLQCGNPSPLRLLGYLPGDLGLERAMHSILARHRLQGEWFAAHPEVLKEAAPAARHMGRVERSRDERVQAVRIIALMEAMEAAA